jgi:hypothetical protein
VLYVNKGMGSWNMTMTGSNDDPGAQPQVAYSAHVSYSYTVNSTVVDMRTQPHGHWGTTT